MTTYLGKSYSFGLLCMSLMNVYQFVCVVFTFWFSGWDVRFDCIHPLIPDHCFLIYSTSATWYFKSAEV